MPYENVDKQYRHFLVWISCQQSCLSCVSLKKTDKIALDVLNIHTTHQKSLLVYVLLTMSYCSNREEF